MCDALNMARAEQGKTTQQHHYTNESNMISRIVLGWLTAKQWARINGYSGEPRDHMNAEQRGTSHISESTNITLIDMGMEYEQRKGELARLSQRWLAKRLEAVPCLSRQEHHNLKKRYKRMPTGALVTVESVSHNRVTFYRDGYQSPCVQPLARFMKEFAEVNKCLTVQKKIFSLAGMSPKKSSNMTAKSGINTADTKAKFIIFWWWERMP